MHASALGDVLGGLLTLLVSRVSADKQSGVVLRAPFLETVLKQVRGSCSLMLNNEHRADESAGWGCGTVDYDAACMRPCQPAWIRKWQCQISQQSMLNDSGCRGADAHCVLLHLQPFYSTERITELVRDCEQQLGGSWPRSSLVRRQCAALSWQSTPCNCPRSTVHGICITLGCAQQHKPHPPCRAHPALAGAWGVDGMTYLAVLRRR